VTFLLLYSVRCMWNFMFQSRYSCVLRSQQIPLACRVAASQRLRLEDVWEAAQLQAGSATTCVV